MGHSPYRNDSANSTVAKWNKSIPSSRSCLHIVIDSPFVGCAGGTTSTILPLNGLWDLGRLELHINEFSDGLMP